MREAPSTLTAMVILAVFLCLGPVKIFAQCSLCVSAVDLTCSGTFADCGTSTAGCAQSAVFQVSCNGDYKLGADSYYCTNACNCETCVLVVKVSSGYIVGSTNTNCANQSCIGSVLVYLETGYDYRLYVCKRPCSSDFGIDCDDCDTACKARGWVASMPSPGCP